MNRARTVMVIVATVKKYAELSSAQRSRVERVVQRQYQGRLDREKKALAPTYAKRRAEVQRRTTTRVTAVRTQSPGEAAKLEADSRKELAALDADWGKAAARNVDSKYGTDYAVPMKNPDGKPVVAFASVSDGSVRVASSAYEVGGNVAQGSTVKHGGKDYAVVGESVSF
jgi:hypothetical protein